MLRFKKEVVIGGVHGRELDGLVSAVVDAAVEADTVHETKAVLHEALVRLIHLAPSSPGKEELFEAKATA